MTTQETQEGNKLIAEFMGFKWNSKKTTMYYGYDDSSIFVGRYFPINLKFHSSWNWLMPVVEKIESLGYDTSITRDGMKYSIIIENIYLSEHTDEYSKIQATWQAVVEFIKWYKKLIYETRSKQS